MIAFTASFLVASPPISNDVGESKDEKSHYFSATNVIINAVAVVTAPGTVVIRFPDTRVENR